MWFPSLVINKNIIEEYQHKVVQEGPKKVVHEAIKSG
jgi:hypothetical protein